MGLLSRLERIWDRDKGYATRYSIVFSGSVFIHTVLALMFFLNRNLTFAVMNCASILLYILWLIRFSKKPIDDIMLIAPYLDVVIHACIYNVVLGAVPAFYLYTFTIIPVSYFLSIRDSKSGKALLISTILAVIGVLLMLLTLSGTPTAPFADSELNAQFFQVNMLICSLLLGIYTWEFLTETRNTQDDLSRHAEYDLLTGLRNRYSLSKETSGIHGTQYCVIMCDIDDFKQVNDQYGHTVGDMILSRIGKTLTSSLRREDLICRWGGEEFLLVVKSDPETARAAAERIRRKMNTVAVEAEKSSVSVTMTFGIADCMEGDSFDKVVSIADSRLLLGKRSGKNCIISDDSAPAAASREPEHTELDTAYLEGSIFSAFAATSDTTYIYICNLDTNVSRWSKSAVEYFGLPGEYMYDAGNIWLGFVHPDDREMYAQDIEAVLSGRKRVHDVTYRARNKDGEFVTCVCKGVVTEGNANQPSLFAGTMTNLGTAASKRGAEK